MTAHCATYVLQWKFFDKPALHSHSPLDVIDSITTPHHKAKVMYYYEVGCVQTRSQLDISSPKVRLTNGLDLLHE